MPQKSRRYRPIVEQLFKAGVCTIRCAAPAQKRVRKMVINEKHIYERERSMFSSKYRTLITVQNDLVTFKLVPRFTGDNFITEALLIQSAATPASQTTVDFDLDNIPAVEKLKWTRT